MLFKDKLKEPVIYKGSNKAINELNQIQEYLTVFCKNSLTFFGQCFMYLHDI